MLGEAAFKDIGEFLWCDDIHSHSAEDRDDLFSRNRIALVLKELFQHDSIDMAFTTLIDA